jgi:putative DNA primase/helicase
MSSIDLGSWAGEALDEPAPDASPEQVARYLFEVERGLFDEPLSAKEVVRFCRHRDSPFADVWVALVELSWPRCDCITGGEAVFDFFDFEEKRIVFVVERVGRIVRAEGRVERGHDQRLYRYTHGVYVPDGDDYAKERTRDLLGSRWAASHESNVIKWLLSFPVVVKAEPPAHLLNVANGLLELDTGVLRPHSPSVASPIQLPVAWRPDASCPMIDAFLREVLPSDCLELAYELIGYALFAGNPLQIAVMLTGPGANGKTVFLNLVVALCGAENVVHVPLQVLTEQRFATADLFGKLANICGDLDARAVRHSDTLKMITGEDTIRGERKYRDPFWFRPFCLCMFSANELPGSADQTEAWFRRWLILPLPNTIPVERRDPHLTTKLTAPPELEGLLVQAVHGLRRLLARGRFDLPASAIAAQHDHREQLDTVSQFIDERCTLDAAGMVSREALWAAYTEWCRGNGATPVSPHQLYARTRALPGVGPKKSGPFRGFTGIVVTSSWT